MIIDSHVHYNLEPLFLDWKTYWNEAQKEDVGASIVVGTSDETNDRAVTIADQDPHLFAAIGIHPNEPLTPSACASSFTHLKRLLQQSKRIVAIGECGLDFFRLPDDEQQQKQEKDRQVDVFKKHIDLAYTHNLPLIIHCRDAHTELIRTLSSFEVRRFVLHCMSGTSEYLQQAIKLGGYISFAGNVTYKNAEALRELVKQTPIDRLLVETDAPYLPPAPWRGEVNRPRYIAETIRTLSHVLNISENACRIQTAQNTRRFFALPL